MDLLRFLGYAAQTQGFGLARPKRQSNFGLYTWLLALGIVIALVGYGCYSLTTID